MKSRFVGITPHILFLCLVLPCMGQPPAPSGVDTSPAHGKPLVLLSSMDHRANGEISFQLPKMGFAVGDGTLIVTAEHCIDSFLAQPPHSTSRQLVAISPYYGDIFPVRMLAFDDAADVAILEASWQSHPAFALAEPSDIHAGDTVMIPSRPQFTNDEQQINKQFFLEHLTVERIDHEEPDDAILFTKAGLIKPGWSGSPIVLRDSRKVAGVMCLLKYSTKTRALFFKTKTLKAAGCHIDSIRRLVQDHDLQDAAMAVQPTWAPDIRHSETTFEKIQDAFNALLAKDMPTALTRMQRSAEARPNSAYLQLWLANIASAQAPDTEEEKKAANQLAETALDTALLLAPEDPHILAVAGTILSKHHKMASAKAHSLAALAQDPNNSLALYTQLILGHGRDPNRAAAYGQRLTDSEPNNTMAWFYTSTALFNDSRPEEALHAAQQAVATDPNGLIREALAKALVALDRIDEAQDEFKFMTENCECEKCWYQYARFLVRHRSDQAVEAQHALDAARSSSRKRSVPPKRLDQLQIEIYKHTDPNQALALLHSWLDEDPNEADTWWRLADILRTKAHYEEAAEAAQKAVDLAPDSFYRPRLADCLAKAGDSDSAQAVFDTMLERHPERPRYWYYYAKYLQESHKPDLARIALERTDAKAGLSWQVSQKERDDLLAEIAQTEQPLAP